MNSRDSRTAWIGALLIAVAFLVGFFATLNHYGMTWDEPENFYTGERNLRFFLSWDRDWVTFPDQSFVDRGHRENYKVYTEAVERFNQSSWHDFRPETNDRFARRTLAYVWPLPPVANTAAAITNEVFFRRLGVLDPIPAHHAAIGLIWAGLLVAVYRFTWRLRGHLAAAVATGTLILTPRLWGPVHNNIKDLPLTAFFAFTLIALYKGVTEGRLRWIVASAVLAGLTVGTKLNGAFVFLVAGMWLGAGFFKQRPNRRMVIALLTAPVVAGGTFLATWPYLWSDPISRSLRVASYARDILQATPPQRVGYAAFYAVITTPPAVIAFAALGVIWVLSRGWRPPFRPGLLLALWFAVPIGRASLPRTGFYDGIRQFMEYWPALAVVAGIGAGELAQWLGPRAQRVFRNPRARTVAVGAIVAVIALTPSGLADLRAHPYEDTYFSELIGGLRGARARGVQWATDYWGSSYLETVRWANRNLDREAIIIAPIAGHLLWFDGLREDLSVQPGPPTKSPRRDTYLVYITRDEFYPSWLRTYDKRRPDRLVESYGAPIQKVYRIR